MLEGVFPDQTKKERSKIFLHAFATEVAMKNAQAVSPVPVDENSGFFIPADDTWTSGFSRRGEMMGYPLQGLNGSSAEQDPSRHRSDSFQRKD